MNPYLLLVLLFIGIYYVNNYIIKLRANKLLKIIYRMIFFEKRHVGFIFMQSRDNSVELSKTLWEKNINRKKVFSELEESHPEYEKLFKFSNLSDFSIHFDDNSELVFTYNEYLMLCEKFKESVIKKRTMFDKSKNDFNEDMKLLKIRNGLQYTDLLDEYEIFDEYYYFPPTQSQIIQLLEYLKKNLYINDINNIQLTKKAYDSLNLADKIESSIDLEKLIEIMSKVI